MPARIEPRIAEPVVVADRLNFDHRRMFAEKLLALWTRESGHTQRIVGGGAHHLRRRMGLASSYGWRGSALSNKRRQRLVMLVLDTRGKRETRERIQPQHALPGNIVVGNLRAFS